MNAAQETIARGVAGSKSIAAITLSAGALASAPAMIRSHFGGRATRLVADENTWPAAGVPLESFLRAAGIGAKAQVLTAKPKPKPSVELASELMEFLATDDAVPVAVGSGVINDLVKYAAFKLGRPYICVATAASMDGYTSAGAPLSEKGFKKTIQCRPPKAIIGDLDVLCAAPPDMSGWGYADLAGKVPATRLPGPWCSSICERFWRSLMAWRVEARRQSRTCSRASPSSASRWRLMVRPGRHRAPITRSPIFGKCRGSRITARR